MAKPKARKGPAAKPAAPERLTVLVTMTPYAHKALATMYARRGWGPGKRGRSDLICEAILRFARYDEKEWQNDLQPSPSSST